MLCALPLRIIKVRIEMLAAVLEVVSDIDRLTHGGQGPLTPTGKGGERGPLRVVVGGKNCRRCKLLYSPITDSQVKVPEEILGLLV